MKKLKKIIVFGVAGLVVIVIAGIIIISLSLGSVIKTGIITVLPEMTGTEVKLDNFSFSIFAGRAKIKNFVIGNPDGYNTEYAFKVGEMVIDLEPLSLLSNKIVIEEIFIDKAIVSYETAFSEDNLSVIKKNIDNFCKVEEKKETQSAKEDGIEKPPKRYQIDKFDFKNSSVVLSLKAIKGQSVSVSLPEVHLEGIGADSQEGATISEVAEKVSTDLINSIIKSVKEADKGSIKKSADKILDKVDSLF